MSKKEKVPETLALRVLKKCDIPFEVFEYKYEPRGGTRVSSRELGVDEHVCIKTIILETDAKEPFIVLMHGDLEISTKNMARILGVKSVKPCEPAVADKHSGYQVGGTSPFGTKRRMRVFVESTILDEPFIYINAGHRGILVAMDPRDLDAVLPGLTVPVDVAIEQ